MGVIKIKMPVSNNKFAALLDISQHSPASATNVKPMSAEYNLIIPVSLMNLDEPAKFPKVHSFP